MPMKVAVSIPADSMIQMDKFTVNVHTCHFVAVGKRDVNPVILLVPLNPVKRIQAAPLRVLFQ